LLSALIVILAWGVNFVVIKVGLHGVPPMLLGALRFSLVALPAVFFIKRPAVPLKWVVAYGATISLGQFVLLFYAMSVGMPAGLASLVLQAQAFFTLMFAAMILGEQIRGPNIVGLLIAACGLAVIGVQAGHAMTVAGFVLTLAASAMWGMGNVITKRMGKVDLLSLVVWASLVPPLPFLAFIATMLGYTLWGKLLGKYPASQVAPFSLLVPIVGLASAALLLDEGLSVMQLLGAVLVMAGLFVNVFGGWLMQRLMPAR
jgi:O-acetylserine/cysteine efflux transporter